MLLLLPAMSAGSARVPAPAAEYDLKAAFLFNFAHFVGWPSESLGDTATPFTIGVLGTDPFGASLDQITTGESIGVHPLRVRRYRTVEEVTDCQILFVSASERAHLDEIVARLRNRSILTVGDMDGFAAHAGMIGFVTAKSRLRLQINSTAAHDEHLKISSQLLRQAKIVTSPRPRP